MSESWGRGREGGGEGGREGAKKGGSECKVQEELHIHVRKPHSIFALIVVLRSTYTSVSFATEEGSGCY